MGDELKRIVRYGPFAPPRTPKKPPVIPGERPAATPPTGGRPETPPPPPLPRTGRTSPDAMGLDDDNSVDSIGKRLFGEDWDLYNEAKKKGIGIGEALGFYRKRKVGGVEGYFPKGWMEDEDEDQSVDEDVRATGEGFPGGRKRDEEIGPGEREDYFPPRRRGGRVR